MAFEKVKKRNKFSKALLLTSNILAINFIHTFTYSFEWILKEKGKSLYITPNGTVLNGDENYENFESHENYIEYSEVGGLLVGNLYKFYACHAQGFLLIFSSLSQDLLIIIIFFFLNRPKMPNKGIILIILIFVGYCFPLLFAFIYIGINALGLNQLIFTHREKYKLFFKSPLYFISLD